MVAMSRLKTQKYLALMLLVFAGQTFAMPFLDCCAANEDIAGKTQKMDSHHDMAMSAQHHSKASHHTNDQAGETYCNHQCDVCAGAVLLGEYASITRLPAPDHLNAIYHFILPISSSDNPFRPPISA
tara:strand:+ start:1962 stop:2342 length:381 start_codon:yes stop_codon:yes gene_type:complete